MSFEYITNKLEELMSGAKEFNDPAVKNRSIMDLKSELDQMIEDLHAKNLIKEVTIQDVPWG